MKDSNHFRRFIKLAKSELRITLAMLAFLGIAVGLIANDREEIAGDQTMATPADKSVSVATTSPILTINGIPAQGLNFTAKIDSSLYKVTNGWIGAAQNLATGNGGTYGLSTDKTYTYKAQLDEPFTGMLQLSGQFQSVKVNNNQLVPTQPFVRLNNADALVISFTGGNQNIISYLKIVSATAGLTVASLPNASLYIVPSPVEVTVGQQLNLRVMSVNPLGQAVTVSPNWTIVRNSNNAVSLSSGGQITGLALGNALAVAQVGSAKASVEITVKPADKPSALGIVAERMTPNFTATLQNLFAKLGQ
ncbi:MAG: hypothetical protein V1826_00200 [bacterium]